MVKDGIVLEDEKGLGFSDVDCEVHYLWLKIYTDDLGVK